MREIEKMEEIEEMAKIINSKCRFDNCKECVKGEDTCCDYATAEELVSTFSYRKQEDTVKEFAEKIKKALEKYRLENEEFINGQWIINASILCAEFTNGILDKIAAEFGKEE